MSWGAVPFWVYQIPLGELNSGELSPQGFIDIIRANEEIPRIIVDNWLEKFKEDGIEIR